MAQLTDCGKITLDATGPAPRNEEDALEICHRLVQVLNSSGCKWSAPVAGHQDIDAESMNTDGDRLQMQVVRATEDTSFWRDLNVSGTASREYNTTSAAAQLLAVIRKKAAKYASTQKEVLTLVLDAARTPTLPSARWLPPSARRTWPSARSLGSRRSGQLGRTRAW